MAWTVYLFCVFWVFLRPSSAKRHISATLFSLISSLGVLKRKRSCARHGFREKRMKAKYILLVAMLFVGNSMFAQKPEFTRGKGFLIRPELYSGLFVNGGYQFNPFWQVSLGVGATIDRAWLSQVGVRVYTNKGNWAGMFDYHFKIGKRNWNTLIVSALVGGASYKDLDFGLGMHTVYLANYLGFGHAIGIGPTITVGWNIRLYNHR